MISVVSSEGCHVGLTLLATPGRDRDGFLTKRTRYWGKFIKNAATAFRSTTSILDAHHPRGDFPDRLTSKWKRDFPRLDSQWDWLSLKDLSKLVE